MKPQDKVTDLMAQLEQSLEAARAARRKSDYLRRLEDAALILWEEMPVHEATLLRQDCPDLMDFLAHLHHAVEHEQAMTRVNVWASR